MHGGPGEPGTVLSEMCSLREAKVGRAGQSMKFRIAPHLLPPSRREPRAADPETARSACARPAKHRYMGWRTCHALAVRAVRVTSRGHIQALNPPIAVALSRPNVSGRARQPSAKGIHPVAGNPLTSAIQQRAWPRRGTLRIHKEPATYGKCASGPMNPDLSFADREVEWPACACDGVEHEPFVPRARRPARRGAPPSPALVRTRDGTMAYMDSVPMLMNPAARSRVVR